ncbi:MAG: sigma-70 family RNA polymerase sigma factor [Chloroflexota bacterium]
MIDDELDERQLVERAKRGDAFALGALYDRYAERIFRFTRFRLGDPHDAEDVAQRVFLKMIEALPRYHSRGTPFGAWLFRIARNAVIDHQRGRRLPEPLEMATDQPSAAPGPEELAISATEVVALEAALNELTEEQRDVIAYRFFAGLSPREIGALMGRREGSVRALQFRALGSLRRHLGHVVTDDPATDEAAQ